MWVKACFHHVFWQCALASRDLLLSSAHVNIEERHYSNRRKKWDILASGTCHDSRVKQKKIERYWQSSNDAYFAYKTALKSRQLLLLLQDMSLNISRFFWMGETMPWHSSKNILSISCVQHSFYDDTASDIFHRLKSGHDHCVLHFMNSCWGCLSTAALLQQSVEKLMGLCPRKEISSWPWIINLDTRKPI